MMWIKGHDHRYYDVSDASFGRGKEAGTLTIQSMAGKAIVVASGLDEAGLAKAEHQFEACVMDGRRLMVLGGN